MSISGIGATNAQSYLSQVYPTQQATFSPVDEADAGDPDVTSASGATGTGGISSGSPIPSLSSTTMQALLQLTQSMDALDPGSAAAPTSSATGNSSANASGAGSSTQAGTDPSDTAIDSNSQYLASLLFS
jgi:hypothetical protein